MRRPCLLLLLLLSSLLASCASPPARAPDPVSTSAVAPEVASDIVPTPAAATAPDIKPAATLDARPAIGGFRQAGVPLNAVAIDVRAADGGGSLFSMNSERSMQPASVMKLVPTQAALELLGPAYRWITRVHTNAAIVDGVLDGDLAIEGSGDPQFAYQDLWRLLARLRALGLRDIRGRLLIDRSLFAPVIYDPAAFDGKPERAYNAAPDALLLNVHALNVRFAPAARTQSVTLVSEPPLDGFTVDVPRLSDEPCTAPYEQLQAAPGPDRLRFLGRYPLACGERDLVFHLHTLDTVRYVGTIFRALWSQLGGRFSGSVAEGTVPAGSRELAAWTSEPLSLQIREINKQSNNAMARNLMLSIVAQRGAAPSTASAASARVLAWMASAGIDTSAVVLQNGSGLSRDERMSAETLAALLQRAWRQPTMPEFIAALPVAGVDGTMARRFAGSPLQGSAHIKTGSLAGVASIAGYVTARSGRRMVVVCMVNHPNAQSARTAFDQLLTWVWENY